MNPRRAIRHALKAQIEAMREQSPADFPNLAGVTVLVSATTPLFDRDFPAVVISTSSERIERTPQGFPGRKSRVLEAEIYVYAINRETTGGELQSAEGLVDDIAGDIESAIARDDTLGQRVEVARLTAIAFDSASNGDNELFVALMTFEIEYSQIVGENEGPEPDVPSRLFLGIDPETGHENEPAYIDLTGEDFP